MIEVEEIEEKGGERGAKEAFCLLILPVLAFNHL